MFGWLARLRYRSDEHEPEVQEAQREQRQKFDVWEAAKREVLRVQDLAEHKPSDRPHRRAR